MKSIFASVLVLLFSSIVLAQTAASDSFRFAVTADMRFVSGPENDTIDKYRGVLQALKKVGAGEFMVSPGDIDPPQDVRWSISKYLGADYPWYPVVGNHEEETKEDMVWLRNYNKGGDALPYIVNTGPAGAEETTFSFDYKNAHFVVVNEYYDGKCDTCLDGDISDPLYEWLKNDLQKTTQKYIFVFGHEPAFPQPDAYTFNLRHYGNSLDKYRQHRDRFWNLLEANNVVAYFCGHTHCFSAIVINNVWQIDAAHARGGGDKSSTMPSTFIVVDVIGENVQLSVYRNINDLEFRYQDFTATFDLRKK